MRTRSTVDHLARKCCFWRGREGATKMLNAKQLNLQRFGRHRIEQVGLRGRRGRRVVGLSLERRQIGSWLVYGLKQQQPFHVFGCCRVHLLFNQTVERAGATHERLSPAHRAFSYQTRSTGLLAPQAQVVLWVYGVFGEATLTDRSSWISGIGVRPSVGERGSKIEKCGSEFYGRSNGAD